HFALFAVGSTASRNDEDLLVRHRDVAADTLHVVVPLRLSWYGVGMNRHTQASNCSPVHRLSRHTAPVSGVSPWDGSSNPRVSGEDGTLGIPPSLPTGGPLSPSSRCPRSMKHFA